jgi:two-component system OmpR family response regulator
MKILVVEDDSILGMGLYKSLGSKGFDVTLASTGIIAESVLYQKFDLVILDLGLPDIDGIDILKKLRKKSIVPILILSARSDIKDKINGLECGADDYMVKPFELNELLARVKALTRRSISFKTNIIIGKIIFNIFENKIKVDNQILDLPLREYKILEFLILKRGSVVSKDNIADYLCSSCGELSDNAIEVYVHRLRKRFELLDVHIKTIHGIGYLIQEEIQK